MFKLHSHSDLSPLSGRICSAFFSILILIFATGCLDESPMSPAQDLEPSLSLSGSSLPAGVTDLRISGATTTSLTLTWTQVDDGRNKPARYRIRYSVSPMVTSIMVSEGACGDPIAGTKIGATLSCTVTGLSPGTAYDFKIRPFREANGKRIWGEVSPIATGTTTLASTPPKVTTLAVETTTANSVTLRWNEVSDGAGGASQYEVRYAATPIGWGWGSATTVTSGGCASPIGGTGVGNTFTCTVSGLNANSSYDFQLVAFRPTTGERVYGPLSNVTTGETGSATVLGGGGGTGTTGGTYPNQPAGFSLLTDRNFDLLEELGWKTNLLNPNFSLVLDQNAPESAPLVGRMRFPAGLIGGTGPSWTENWNIGSGGARRIYITYWVKLSDNWQGHPINDKLIYVWTHEKPVVYPVYVGGGTNPLTSQVVTQDDPDGGVRFFANRTDVQIHRGQWHRWELVLVNNTGDNRDGQLHWWIDGTKVGEYTNVRFSTSSQKKVWESVAWSPVWGGQGGVVQNDMHMFMDRIYASGAP